MYEYIMRFSLTHNYTSLGLYLLDHLEEQDTHHRDIRYFMMACQKNNVSIVKRLIRRGVNPVTANILSSFYVGELRLTSREQNIFSTVETNLGLYLALSQGSIDVVQVLLAGGGVVFGNYKILVLATLM